MSLLLTKYVKGNQNINIESCAYTGLAYKK